MMQSAVVAVERLNDLLEMKQEKVVVVKLLWQKCY